MQGISRQEALRHLDWAAFQNLRVEIKDLEAQLGTSIRGANNKSQGGFSQEPSQAFSATSAPPSRAGAPATKLTGPARKLATRKLNAKTKQLKAVVADARSRAVNMEPPRNLLEFTLDTFTEDEVMYFIATDGAFCNHRTFYSSDLSPGTPSENQLAYIIAHFLVLRFRAWYIHVKNWPAYASECSKLQIQDVAAVTIQSTIFAIGQRTQLMRARISVLRVQRACLAALLRHWEGRFAQFLSAEQAQLIAGHGEVVSRKQKVRGNLDERRTLLNVCYCSFFCNWSNNSNRARFFSYEVTDNFRFA